MRFPVILLPQVQYIRTSEGILKLNNAKYANIYPPYTILISFPSFKNKEFSGIRMDLGLHCKVDISLYRGLATFPCITVYLQIFKQLHKPYTATYLLSLVLPREVCLSRAHKGLT